MPINVADNPVEKEVITYNPNYKEVANDSSESEEDEYVKTNGGPGTSSDR